MAERRGLVGRKGVWAELNAVLAETAIGRGGLVLLAGEAGVGKTRLATEALEHSGLAVLGGSASAATASGFGPIVAALRGFLRLEPEGRAPFDRLGRLGRYLPVLLPELGPALDEVDRATLFEAILGAFVCVARRQPTVVFLDDVHDADHATLELLPYLAAGLAELPLLVLATYRTDELRRDHPLRRLRTELRRAGRLRELVVEPLDVGATGALAAHILGRPASPALVALLYERTDGLPLFIEELLAALASAGRLEEGDTWHLTDPERLVPVPETIRDLVLLRAAQLSAAARLALEVAAVAGVQFEVEVVDALAGVEDVLSEVVARGFVLETRPGLAAFRHGLIRDAFYYEIGWPRRRALHRQLAEYLERRGAAPTVLAEHWLAGRDAERARQALLLALDAACQVLAHRDAATLAERALELWPEGELEAERLVTLDRLGQCAQLSGDLATAAATWREVADTYRRAGAPREQAEAQRRLAGVYELQGAWDQARLARETSAEAFAAAGRPGEAATERLTAAGHLRMAASYGPALQLVTLAAIEAQVAGRVDLQARLLGLEGDIRSRLGQYEVGVEQVQHALGLALEHNLSSAAAEVYQRLADALEQTGDYRAARQAYLDAAVFCQTSGAPSTAELCRACMTVVLRQTGEWERCSSICTEILATRGATIHARTVALGMLGLVRAHQGDASRARPLLVESSHQAVHLELAPMELLSGWGLAIVDELAGRADAAASRCLALLDRWARTEERHYAIPALRWATGVLAAANHAAGARACANALAQIVAETGAAEAVAALGHALGELSVLDGEPAQAARHFAEALDCLSRLDLPLDQAQTKLRAGVALVSAGQREEGVQHLVESYRHAQGLGARPLAAAAGRELARLGEAIEGRVGRRAAGLLERGGLTRRELEVLRLVAEGHTDREIAQTLVLSPRTIEMHVANCLAKLGCRSRAEAVRRAADLQLLAPAGGVATTP